MNDSTYSTLGYEDGGETQKPPPSALFAYIGIGVLTLIAILVTGLAPYSTPPVLGQPIGVVFSPFSDAYSNFSALRAADPDMGILDTWYDDRVIFVVSESPDFLRNLSLSGAIHTFDAVSAGCHTAIER
jgi:hypothetical protein